MHARNYVQIYVDMYNKVKLLNVSCHKKYFNAAVSDSFTLYFLVFLSFNSAFEIEECKLIKISTKEKLYLSIH